jgi:hypothetical protein
VSYATDGITCVRVRPLAIGAADGAPVLSPGAVEATWQSGHAGMWHQVYVRGRLAGVTARPEDRRLIVAAPTDACGGDMTAVEIVAVEAADRWTDHGADLGGFGAGRGNRVRLTWQAGEYLDASLDSFAVFADGRTGTVDYAAPLNAAPIPARPGGLTLWGYGQAAAAYEWVTGPLEPGLWRFAVVAIDAAGNRLATAAETTVAVTPLPRPVGNMHIAAYDAQARTATLAWDASPDVGI